MTCVIIIIGSKQNGTVHEARMHTTIKNRLYLCSTYETKMQFTFAPDLKTS